MTKCCIRKDMVLFRITVFSILCLTFGRVFSQHQEQKEDVEQITSTRCPECHETSKRNTVIIGDISRSIHNGLVCLDCHSTKNTLPHKETPEFHVGCNGCRTCHEDAAAEYTAHGRVRVGECVDMPFCSDCHGDHDVLPSSNDQSKTNPNNLSQTCGTCHENLDLTRKYEILIDFPIKIYNNSIHGKAVKGAIHVAATCNDCHSTAGSVHKIYSPGIQESSINHFTIPQTCGKCHIEVENDYWQGIHGKLAKRGETDAPVCTDCHGEHGILSHNDPRSPVSPVRLAEATCAPCHESVSLTEKYGMATNMVVSFLDSYHGLKTKAGDFSVANCASCHGFHRILPSSDSTSTIHPDNLQKTCGGCHPGISAKLAATPIHSFGGEGLQTKTADTIEKIYIIAILIIVGLMSLHLLLDLFHQIRLLLKRSQVIRMRLDEVGQHTLLMVSFMVLVVSGFSLRFSESWISQLLFGFHGGFELRGTVHRIAAAVLILTVVWHLCYLLTNRGKQFVKDIFPSYNDIKDFYQQIRFYLGGTKEKPRFGRFSYVEKFEYWALVCGTGIMAATGVLLWFDNVFIQFLPLGVLDVMLVIHYYEAILASLSILIWHLYATVFNPKIYPMNPSWLTGKMPKEMIKHAHPDEQIEKIEGSYKQ